MRAVILEVDERMLAERQRLGLDQFDEMWEGVLHMVPQPSRRHQELGSGLARYLYDSAAVRGCRIALEVGMYAAGTDYRVPDLAVYPPEAGSTRGVDGAPLVVFEIRSPADESYDKVPWYLGRGAGSIVIIDQDTFSVEVFTADGRAEPDSDGLVAIPGLGVRLGAAPDASGLLVDAEEGVHRIDA
jgi:Uma2 family endonuclease